MTDTEKAALERRIDELCAEVEYNHQTSRSRLERIDQLKAENAKLRADQAHWELGNCPSCPNIADLQEALEQNAKLRELMSVMAYCNQFRRDCDGCRMNGEAGTITERAGCDALLDCLRDAGIEVPS